jgi:LmbE family N-acetylglucosaminyl deacetylase
VLSSRREKMMSEGKLTILAVGGHIGDMELTAGMALAKHALEGAHIVILALTAGEKGAPAGRDIADYRKQKVGEAKSFAGRFYYAENWEDAVDFKPYLFIDTTKGYELWKKAVAAHWFVTGSTSFPYLEYYDHLSRVRGMEARKGRAECFMIPSETCRVIREGL